MHKIIHIADVHFRGLSRHDEYRTSFENAFKTIKEEKPDIIYIGGDIVHSKTQGISPELISILNWWFTSLASLAPTHVILGNHDGLILNKHRMDTISPIIEAIGSDNIKLYKDSGMYETGIEGLKFGVFSCFDEENWKNIKPNKNDINVALYHGAVFGSVTDVNWELEGECGLEQFKGFDFGMFGDIHKRQELDPEGRFRYCGSTIQQNYGETPDKGYLVWEIKSKTDWNVRFKPVYHKHPFVTIPWKDSIQETLDAASKFPDYSRFRIRSSYQLTQSEIKEIYSLLKKNKKAHEIVFKVDEVVDEGNELPNNVFTHNLRQPEVLINAIKEYHKDHNVNDDEWEKISSLVEKLLLKYTDSDVGRYKEWQVKEMEFSNTFSYGKDNRIKFSKLNGITGLFGKNRSGKSSIPGTLMYGMFNSSDRGSLKNYHIINTRKGHCEVELKFSVGGKNYKLQRQSVKRQLKNGKTHSVTNLNLFELDAKGDEVMDLCGEQRKDTDKVIESLIGKKEDFLMTSFSSQGDINHFISKGPVHRMATLNNFLDLRLFDSLYKNCREESSLVRGKVQKFPNKDWDAEIDDCKDTIDRLSQKHNDLNKEIKSLREKKEKYSLLLATNSSRDIVTPSDLRRQKRLLEDCKNQLEMFRQEIFDNQSKISNSNNLISKFSNIKSAFPIEEIHASQKLLNDNINKVSIIKSKLSYEKEKLNALEVKYEGFLTKIKMLENHEYDPDCEYCSNNKFVKEAHEAIQAAPSVKNDIGIQEARIANLNHDLKNLKNEVNSLKKQNLSDKIEKYKVMIDRESNEKENIIKLTSQNNIISLNIQQSEEALEKLHSDYLVMSENVSEDDESNEVEKLKESIMNISNKISKGEKITHKCIESIGDSKSKLARLIEDKKEYEEAMSEWKIWDLITKSFSKKGIPNSILTSQLPKINSEIKKILQGVVNFIIELEDTGNGIEIYINYGDSRRIIECSSGMEKMISSIAIRVALINISTLPKSNIFIIDEGFGALDATNVEACSRLLQNLKKWFRTIIIISHIDGIKDCVDNIIEITSEGKDSKVIYE